MPSRVGLSEISLSIILGWMSHSCTTKITHGYKVTKDLETGFHVYIASQRLIGYKPQDHSMPCSCV